MKGTNCGSWPFGINVRLMVLQIIWSMLTKRIKHSQCWDRTCVVVSTTQWPILALLWGGRWLSETSTHYIRARPILITVKMNRSVLSNVFAFFISILCFLLQTISNREIEVLDKHFSTHHMQERFWLQSLLHYQVRTCVIKFLRQLYPLRLQ